MSQYGWVMSQYGWVMSQYECVTNLSHCEICPAMQLHSTHTWHVSWMSHVPMWMCDKCLTLLDMPCNAATLNTRDVSRGWDMYMSQYRWVMSLYKCVTSHIWDMTCDAATLDTLDICTGWVVSQNGWVMSKYECVKSQYGWVMSLDECGTSCLTCHVPHVRHDLQCSYTRHTRDMRRGWVMSQYGWVMSQYGWVMSQYTTEVTCVMSQNEWLVSQYECVTSHR